MPARSWQIALGVVVVAHLIGQWLDAPTLIAGTQVLIVPTVAGTVWSAATLPRLSAPTYTYAGALGFSWLGDWLPDFAGDHHFVVLVSCFLVAQFCFIATYILFARRAPSWWAVFSYAAVFAALILACARGAGDLLPLVAIYGLALVTAAACSTAVSPLAALGAALFVVSDSMIALETFVAGYTPEHQGMAVMSTYIAAQVLIAYGLLQHRRAKLRSLASRGRLPER